MKKDNLRHLVKSFLETHYKVSRPLLLGFSGGPDSLALLQLLMEDQKFPPLNLHLAHVDHRWRVESEEEAKSLEALAASLNLPFHLHVIENLDTGASNLEDLCRKERLRFFRSLNKTYQFEALILAHHLDDQAETVMKRVFEGSGILHLGGLKSVSQFQEMVIWRPMLSARKEEILHFLEQKGLQAIEDKTNLDTKYLRARMREMIFPGIEKQFGKGISRNLHRLGQSFQELRSYLDRKTERYFSCIEDREGGCVLDFTGYYPLEKVEIKHFMQLFCIKKELRMSSDHLETLYYLLENQAFNKKIQSKNWKMVVFGKKLEITYW